PSPPNAFILYYKSKQQLVLDEHREISNNEVSKMIGKMWHSEPIEERVRWYQLAEKKKLEHIARYLDYKYQPR
ncbi:putative HMG box protein, partial [Gigaspora rosea]